MAITKCGNGHIYDSDLYASCPYCSQGTNEINFKPGTNDTPSTVGFDDIGGSGGNAFNPSSDPFSDNMEAADSGTVFRNSNAIQGDAPQYERTPNMQMGNTVFVDRNTEGIIPVVGWLVCIEGKMRGKSYNLYSKQNRVGRNVKSDAFIEGDNTISAHQCNISYDKRHNTFTMVPKTETNTMYLNDEAVYESVRLKSFDLIEMGSSKFIFVPLCGERFTWESQYTANT